VTAIDRQLSESPGVLRRADAVSVVVLAIWLLFLIPANQVVAPLGGVGQPALLVSLLGAALWVYGKADPRVPIDRTPNPIRWVLVGYVLYIGVNYVLLQTRTRTALEETSSTRSLIVAVALVGVALLVCDATTRRSRLDTLVRALSYAAMVAALIAFVQFFLGFDLPAVLRIPGLGVGDLGYDAITDRAGLNRAAGTMLSPLELGVVMGAVLPLTIHTARHLARRPRLAWGGVGLVGGASMLSISRSGVLAAAIALGVASLAWTWRERANAGLAAVVVIGGGWAAAPGLIGTFRWFFTNMDTDDSAQARIERFPKVVELVLERPWFGRGTGTFTVEEGLLLDHQLYQTAIELGLFGIVVTTALLVTAVAVGGSIWRRHKGSLDGHLALALTGTVIALSITGLMYTAFFYRVHFTLLLVSIGALGAVWRTTLADGTGHAG
jgi:O-antigen ligase